MAVFWFDAGLSSVDIKYAFLFYWLSHTSKLKLCPKSHTISILPVYLKAVLLLRGALILTWVALSQMAHCYFYTCATFLFTSFASSIIFINDNLPTVKTTFYQTKTKPHHNNNARLKCPTITRGMLPGQRIPTNTITPLPLHHQCGVC